MFQTYFPIFRDRKTGKIVSVADPERRKDLVETRQDRRKRVRELVKANVAEAFLKTFPSDKYELAGMEFRWNTDIAEDYICPQVALTGDNRPRRKLKGGFHHEGSRFVMLHRRYFAVNKHLREAGRTYATALLDLIVSEKTNIKNRSKGAVLIEITADKVVKHLGLWEEYENESRRKHVLEDHIATAIMELIREKVMLPESWLVPQTDPNPDRRKAPFYRWKVAELWTTVALVTKEEAKEIEAEQAESSHEDAQPEADQAVLPGLNTAPAGPLPSGADIRAARTAAGLDLRRFSEAVGHGKGRFNTWARYERGEAIRVQSIPEAVWKRVRDFIAQHRPKGA